jgi:divalent metal cation (Fe/Co/Zn/Cd) transporter
MKLEQQGSRGRKMKFEKVLVAGVRIIFAIVASWALISIVARIFDPPERPIVEVITITLLAIVILIVLHRYQDKTRWERRFE